MAYGGTFVPERIVVDLGQTVTWWNTDYNRHSVTAYEKRIPEGAEYFSTGGYESEGAARKEGYEWQNLLKEREKFQHTFETPGYYHYYCIPHEGFDTMAGTVVVRTREGNLPQPPNLVEPDTDQVVYMGPYSYTPEHVTIRPGESVGWVNGTGIAHSVTAESVPDGAEYFASGGFDTHEEAEWDWDGPREGDVLAGDPYVHTFETAGEYSYYCFLHNLNMLGTIEVRDE